MTAPINHVIFTRLNISYMKLPNAVSWFNHRMHVFTTVTIPSVVAQTNKKFIWYIAIDAVTPAYAIEKINKLLAGRVKAELVYHETSLPRRARTVQSMRPRFQTFLERTTASSSWCLSTRLDSDDALHPHFIELVQAARDNQHRLISLDTGAIWMPQYRVRMLRYRANMFVTRVCAPNTVPMSVLEYKTPKMCKDYSAKYITTTYPAWVVLVHGRNKLNSERIAHGRGIGEYGYAKTIDDVFRLRA